MKRLSFTLLLVAGALLCALAGHRPVAAARRPGLPHVFTPRRLGDSIPGELVVRFKPQVTLAAHAQLHRQVGARLLSRIPPLGIETVRVANPAAAARAYRANEGILWVEPNRPRYVLLAPPNDPAYNEIDEYLPFFPELATWYEWDARNIQLVEGWSLWPGRYYTSGSKGADAVRVAVIDTGIDYDHPDFANAGGTSSNSAQGGQLDRALDRTFFSGPPEPDAWDEFGHGTHVTGIIAAATNNAIGCTGNGYNANIVSLKVLDASGSGTSFDVARGITYAADNGCLIINMSVGDYTYSQAEQDAVNYAWGKGTLCIAAAGNDGSGTIPNYPAALTRVLAVSATGSQEELAVYSNFGDYVGIAAPGGNLDIGTLLYLPVYSTTPTYYVTINDPNVAGAQMNYDYLMGTSMASPQVVGLAALLAGQQGWTQSTPGVTLKLWQSLQRACDNVAGGTGNWDPYYGFGRINVYNTLNLSAEPNPRGATAGCIVGQVQYKGTPVQNAVVRAVRAGGGTPVTAASRGDGGYRIANALPGSYNVTASVFGDTQSLPGITVTAGCDTPGIDFNVGAVVVNPPAAPANLTAAPISDSSIRLTWSDLSNNETNFEVERRNGGGPFSPIATVGANVTNFTDTGVAINVTYVYHVRATNAGGPSAWSNEAGASTGGSVASVTITSPNGGEAWVIGEEKTLTWSSSNAGANVRVEWSSDGGATWTILAQSTPNDGSEPITVMSAPTTHARVRATSLSVPSAFDESNGDFVVLDLPGGQLRAPSRINFGRVTAGGNTSRALVLRNTSRTQKLRVTVFDPEDPYALDDGTETALIPARGSHSFNVEFAPPATGKFNKTLRITSGDSRRSEVSVSLTGSGR